MMNLTHWSRPRWLALALLPGLVLGTVLTGCGGDEPTPRPPSADQRPATLESLPSATTLPTDTPEPTATLDAAAEATKNAAGLPEGDEVILQFARIEERDNEPALAAEFRPNFSMRAGGHVVFAFRDEYSQDDWYQTVITPNLAEDFVRTLWDDIGIAELAEKLPVAKMDYTVREDGSITGPGPMGIIYVKSSKGSARLVIPAKDLEAPAGPYGDRLTQLDQVIRCLEWWRGSVVNPLNDDLRQGCAAKLRWWQDRREAWGPDSVTAFGAMAPADLGTGGLAWPLDKKPLSGLIKAASGAKPTRFELKGEDAAAAWRTELSRANGGVGTPLWRDGDASYLIGLSPEVPGSNEMGVPYSFKGPQGAAASEATAAATAPTSKTPAKPGAAAATAPAKTGATAAPTKAGSASQPTAASKATATKKP